VKRATLALQQNDALDSHEQKNWRELAQKV
jgi:hypothetical protein